LIGDAVGLTVVDARPGTDDCTGRDLIGDSESWRKVVMVVLASAVAAVVGEHDPLFVRTHTVGVGGEIPADGLPLRVREVWRLEQLPSKSSVDGELGRHLPVVLYE